MFSTCLSILSVFWFSFGPIEDPPLLHLNGAVYELTSPEPAPTLDSVLEAYGTDKSDAMGLAPFLAACSEFSQWSPGTEPIEIYEIVIDSGFPEEPYEVVLANAFVGSQHAAFLMYIVGDQFYVEMEIEEQSGSYQETISFDPLTPIDWEPGGDLQPLYLHSYAILICKCDTAGGGTCSTDMCDNLTTCPKKNGTSCAWIGAVAAQFEAVPIDPPGG